MSVSKWAYTPEKCDGDICVGDCDFCPKKDVEYRCPNCGAVMGEFDPNLYDVEEVHTDCTVQILRNTNTGEISIGWWENGRTDEH